LLRRSKPIPAGPPCLAKIIRALFMLVNALTQKAYNGVNVVSLWVAAEVKNIMSPVWTTYNQWLELGAQVAKTESPVSSSVEGISYLKRLGAETRQAASELSAAGNPAAPAQGGIVKL